MASRQSQPSRCDLCAVLQERGDDGELVGKDPRKVPPAVLSLYHSEKNPLKALRARCLDCCCGQPGEVRKCIAITCPSWPFRMGINPFRQKRSLSAEHMRRMTEGLKQARGGSDCDRAAGD
jgi:hypothetical protein